MPTLPEAPSLEWLRKQSKHKLADLKREQPGARLADAQRDLAREYGFPSWRALKAHVESLTVAGQAFDAARAGDVARLARLLDSHAGLLEARDKPYAWSLLHAAAHRGRLGAVNLLLERGLDVNTREQGDATTALNWAAAAGHVDVVRRLLDAGADPVVDGDDHGLQVIGWASCWQGTDTPAHREVQRLLLAAGARDHIFAGVGRDDEDAVRRIVAADPAALRASMSRHESRRKPIHLAAELGRPRMIALLIELGADPLESDEHDMIAAHYAAQPGATDATLRALAGVLPDDLFLAVSVRDYMRAEAIIARTPGAVNEGALHLAAKRDDVESVRWLLAHGANPSARWNHWGSMLCPLHLAASQASAEVVRLLLDAGADPTIRDSLHGGDARGWAEHHGRTEIMQMLESRSAAGPA